MLLLLTTALHYFAILPHLIKYYNNILPHYHRVYINLIILSTTFSIIWHYYNEPRNILLFFDYYFGFLWFVGDMLWALDLNNISIVLLNLGCFFLNININYSNNYVLYHSIWHVINAIKSIYVSYIINKNLVYCGNY
jgi:hypothetical protein